MTMLTVKEAAKRLGVSYWVVRDLVDEAYEIPKKARWRVGREFVDLSKVTSQRRLIRIRPDVVGLPSDCD